MRYLGEEEFARDLARLDEAMQDWARYRDSISLRDLLDSKDTRNMVLYAMLVTIQATIRAAHHLIVRDYLPKPGSYEETFFILRKAGILDISLADALARLAKYRHELVYSQHLLNMREIYDTLRNSYSTLEVYKVKLEQLRKQD
jgi:uncharacterized protein YutE (UPF0331/DUF86 family)